MFIEISRLNKYDYHSQTDTRHLLCTFCVPSWCVASRLILGPATIEMQPARTCATIPQEPEHTRVSVTAKGCMASQFVPNSLSRSGQLWQRQSHASPTQRDQQSVVRYEVAASSPSYRSFPPNTQSLLFRKSTWGPLRPPPDLISHSLYKI